MKKIQEVLNQYNVELKSTDRHITVYACKKVEQKSKLKGPAKRVNPLNNTTQSNLLYNDNTYL